jgi:hydrogenase/urease accessory protein HupE
MREPASRRAIVSAIRGTAFLFAALISATANAHDARPLSISISGQTAGVYRVVVQTPPTIEAQNRPVILWPGQCAVTDNDTVASSDAAIALLSCPDGIERGLIRIDYPFYNPSITTLIRLSYADGSVVSAVLPPDELSWQVPAEPTLLGVARDYTALGFRHIWQGIDHLLFVAGLLLLAKQVRRIVWAVTGFTVAHSITLSLAALGLVRPAVAPVEAMIALSIVFLATEILRADDKSFGYRFPIALSFVFGLLHGFGFASALGEIGLPRNELATGLLFFNLGVELGQLAFIAVIATVLLAARPAVRRLRGLRLPGPARIEVACAWCLGIPASFWFFERTVAAFSG